jgi:outer membrane protein
MRTSAAAVRSAYSAFIPAVGVSLGSTKSEGDRYDETRDEFVRQSSWQFSNGIGAQVDLFDGGRRFLDIRRTRAEADAASSSEILARYNVALSVKQQFYAVLAARESEQAARAQLQQAQQQLRAASARVAAGAATKSDSLRSVIQVGNAQLALVTAQNDLLVANAGLTRLVATPFPVTAAAGDSLEPVVVIDTLTLARLAARGPAVEEAEAQVVAARAARRAAKTSYLPSVTASYSRGGNASNPDFRWIPESYSYSNSLRFGLNFQLFDQFGREEQVVRANAAEDNAEVALRDTRLAAQQNLTQFAGQLRTAQQRIRIQETSVAAAEEDLRVQQQRYALGASTLLDVLTSQTQLNQARADLIEARFDARVARAQIEAIIGRSLTAPAGAP